MNYPKEAWYGEYKAKQVHERVYHVWRGEWSDPLYVCATKVVTVPVFGAHIEGKRIDVWEVLDWFDVEHGEGYKPTPQEIAKAVKDCLETIGEVDE